MRLVKHQLTEGFDLHEENKVIAIFYLRRIMGTPVQIKTDTDALMEAEHFKTRAANFPI